MYCNWNSVIYTLHHIYDYLRMQKCCYSIYSLWCTNYFNTVLSVYSSQVKETVMARIQKIKNTEDRYHLPQNKHIFKDAVTILFVCVLFKTHICLMSWIWRCNIYTQKWLNYCSNGTKHLWALLFTGYLCNYAIIRDCNIRPQFGVHKILKCFWYWDIVENYCYQTSWMD